jgi:hypothetical protein
MEVVPFMNVIAPERPPVSRLDVTVAIKVTISLVTGASGDVMSVVWVAAGAAVIAAVGAELAVLPWPAALTAVSVTTIVLPTSLAANV